MPSAKPGRYQVTFAVLAAATAAYALLQSLVVPVLSTIQTELHTSQNTVTWVLTAYLLSASIFTPIMGRIGDMVGKERVLVVTLLLLGTGSLLAAIAPNIGVMIVARVIQGIGGGVLPLSFGIIRDEFPKEKVSSAVGVIASLIAVGAGLGVVLAGPIVTALDYHWLFWLPMGLCFAAAAATHLLVPESPVRTRGRISLLPAVLLSGWLVALLLGVSEAPDWGWTSTAVVALLIAAVVLAVLWVRVELRSAAPLIDMRMMRLPAVWTNNLVALLIGVGMYGSFAFVPELVQTPTSTGYGFGASITRSGLIVLPSSVTMFVVGLIAGRFAASVGGKVVVFLGSAIGSVSLFMIAFAHGAQWELYVATAVMGVGFGLAFAAMSSLVVAAVPAAQTGVASGMNANIRSIGGAVGAGVATSVVTAQLGAGGLPLDAGYTHGFAVLGAAVAIAAVAALAIPMGRPPRTGATGHQAEHGELALVAGGTVVGDRSE